MYGEDREAKGPNSVPNEWEDEVRWTVYWSMWYNWV